MQDKLILGQVYRHVELSGGKEYITIFRPYLWVEDVNTYLKKNLGYTGDPWPDDSGYIYTAYRDDDPTRGIPRGIGACLTGSRLVRESIPYDRYDVEQEVKDTFNGGE